MFIDHRSPEPRRGLLSARPFFAIDLRLRSIGILLVGISEVCALVFPEATTPEFEFEFIDADAQHWEDG